VSDPTSVNRPLEARKLPNRGSLPEFNVRRNFFQPIKDRLWGYDFFISYHWESGGTYAVQLAQRLRDEGYEVFLDRADYASGDDWKAVGEIALHNTKRLILIATREAVTESKPVQREIELFTARNRQVILIIFGDKFEDLDPVKYPTLDRIKESRLHIPDERGTLASGPSEKTIKELIRTHRVMRRRDLRALLTLIPAVAVALFAAFATVSWIRALASAQVARDAKDEAQKATKEALRSNEETKRALETNLEMFTLPTKLVGRIAAAVTRRDTREVSNTFEELVASESPIANSREIADATKKLQVAIQKWDSSEKQSWDTEKEKSSELVRQEVIKFAYAVRQAWEQQFPDTRAAALNRAKEIERQILVKPTYDRALNVTRAIAEGSREPDKIDEFEKLYYSELVFLENDEVANEMIVFRRALRGNPAYVQKSLKDIVSQLKLECDKALNEN
jgi:hypothetical protein